MSPEETAAEHARRLDRELNELLQELRVIQGGILLIIGFLLVIAFSARFEDVTTFQKVTYYLTLLVTGTAAIVVVAPVVHHRLAFRRRDKERIVVRGNVEVLASVFLVALSIFGITILVSDLLWDPWVTVSIGALELALIGVLWFALPIQSIRAADKGR